MSTPSETFSLHQKTLDEAVCQMAGLASEFDNERSAQLVKALGSIANASLELKVILETTVTPQLQAPEVTTGLVVETASGSLMSSEAAETLQLEAPKEIKKRKKSLALDAEVYRPAISFMLSQAGVELKASEILQHVPANDPARRPGGMGKLLNLINTNTPGITVQQRYRTKATKYVVQLKSPGAITEELPVTHKPKLRSTVAKPTFRPRHVGQLEINPDEHVVPLTDWGLEYSLNGHKEIRLSGNTLNLRQAAADILFCVAQYPDGIAFHQLRESLTAYGQKYEPVFLNDILEELGTAFDNIDSDKWSDCIKPFEDSEIRLIQLKGSMPYQDSLDFLAQIFKPGPGEKNGHSSSTKLVLRATNIEHAVSDWTPPVTKVEADQSVRTLTVEIESDGMKSHKSALCGQVDYDMFFPDKGGSTRDPKKVCSECIIKNDCLEESLDSDQHFGVWGGLTERERRRLSQMRADETDLFIQEQYIDSARNKWLKKA